jgi:hypothetical protein
MKAKSKVLDSLPVVEFKNGEISNLDFLLSMSTTVEPNEDSILEYYSAVREPLQRSLLDWEINSFSEDTVKYLRVYSKKPVYNVLSRAGSEIPKFSGEVIMVVFFRNHFHLDSHITFYSTKNSIRCP